MALRPITSNPGNKITLQTWPHLRSGQLADGYELAFASEYGSDGPTPKNPMVVQILPDDDWDEVSPSGWDGTTDVSHQGVVVFQVAPTVAAAPPPPPRIDIFQSAIEKSQNDSADVAIQNFMDEEQSRATKKKVIYVAAGVGILVVGFLIYRRYFA